MVVRGIRSVPDRELATKIAIEYRKSRIGMLLGTQNWNPIIMDSINKLFKMGPRVSNVIASFKSCIGGAQITYL